MKFVPLAVKLVVSMSDFVNYNKRDVGLPANCKNLIDLLPRVAKPRLEDFEIARNEVLSETLSAMEVHVQAFCKFRGAFSELRITEPDDQINVLFSRRTLFSKKTVCGEVQGSISIPPGSPHQQAVRSFLKSRRLEWPEDREFPKAIFPAIPVQIFQALSRFQRVPLNYRD